MSWSQRQRCLRITSGYLVLMNYIVFGCCMYFLSGSPVILVSGSSLPDSMEAGELGNIVLTVALPEMTVEDAAAELFNYTLQLRKGRSYDICRSYVKVRTVLETVRALSASQREHVAVIIEMLHCACDDRKAKCRRHLVCFEREFSGPLCRLCDERLAFNKAQDAQQLCSFLQEAADCKMALMQSSCGHVVSSFLYHLMALLAAVNYPPERRASATSLKCRIQATKGDYSGFRYTVNCPTIFVDDLEMCAARHIDNNLLQFRTDYNLIAATSDPDVIMDSCRSYREYQLCVRPIKKACPRGVQLVYDYQTSLRLYRLKMDYICSKSHRRMYASHAPCYQQLFEKRQKTTDISSPLDGFTACEYLWQRRLKPAFGHVTAFQYYCDPKSSKTFALSRLIHQLAACYETSFSTRCGRDAGKLIGGLVERAFDDPRYTRYRFRPDCQLLLQQQQQQQHHQQRHQLYGTQRDAARSSTAVSSSMSASTTSSTSSTRKRSRRRQRPNRNR